ncbi:MAG: hypothetical protein H6Q00_2999 [Holophagaceae bacterium]|nr:hypothetical protein [Holophagaceae bacterium]
MVVDLTQEKGVNTEGTEKSQKRGHRGGTTHPAALAGSREDSEASAGRPASAASSARNLSGYAVQPRCAGPAGAPRT